MTKRQINESTSSEKPYDVIVVGAGHAGCEAALAAARLGCRTALISMTESEIALMPCNPAIGGIAKSHLVFELDALGGEMAKNTDYTGIQFRVLNTSKGPSVRANRAQCDKEKYARRMAAVVHSQKNLRFLTARIERVWTEKGALKGVESADGSRIAGRAVVLTVGTAPRGMLHIGMEKTPGGGCGREAVQGLSESLRELGFRLRRLKTGTPARLDKGSLHYDRMEVQPGFEPAPFFSMEVRGMFHVEHSGEERATMFHVEHTNPDLFPWRPGSDQIPCYLTHTTPETHDIIRNNLERSALYGGAITGTGVRYCPSVEDKIVKFPDKEQHHVFIEPEGRASPLIYPNGISNSLPRDVQADLIHSIPGLEQAKICEWAYAIEYDFSDPTQLRDTLETQAVQGLYMAGQMNGTTGYEEAAAQGFLAGANAALSVLDRAPLRFDRGEAYLGVLIDDLVTKGTDEPYRMFTSRAEHRLLLRQDNARFRLFEKARALGILDPDRLAETENYATRIAAELDRLARTREGEKTLLQLLRRPEVLYRDLADGDPALPAVVVEQVEITAKYEGYIEREERQVEKMRDIDRVAIPPQMDYDSIRTLRREAREKLGRVQPRTLGQASRIPGISPADIAVISVVMRAGRR